MKKIFLIELLVFGLFSCNLNRQNDNQDKPKVEKVNRQRCSFDLSNKLFLGKIDSSFNEEGYFRILSYKSENRMQLFVFDSQVDIDEKLDGQIKALNSPDVFTAKSIEKIKKFGSYEGKGVIMKGTYEGGVVLGTIKVFCFGTANKGFLIIRQIITNTDIEDFDLIENSFRLK